MRIFGVDFYYKYANYIYFLNYSFLNIEGVGKIEVREMYFIYFLIIMVRIIKVLSRKYFC